MSSIHNKRPLLLPSFLPSLLLPWRDCSGVRRAPSCLVVAVAGELEEGLLEVGLDQVAIMDLQGEIIDCTLIKAP